MSFIHFLYFGATVVVEQDIIVGIALFTHDSSAYLTESHTMSPPRTVEDETLG